MPSLQTLNYSAAFLHFVQAVTVISLIANLNSKHANDPPLMRGIYTIQKNLYIMRNINEVKPKCDLFPLVNISNAKGMNLELHGAGLQLKTNNYYDFMEGSLAIYQNLEVGYLDVRYLIFGFFLLSSSFQALEALAGDYSGPRLLRFVEYSISSSVMILAIAIQVGLSDIYILIAIFTLMFTTNILGLIAELLCYLAESGVGSIYLWILPHSLGWVTCIIAYAPLLDAYLSSIRCSDRGPPGFVHVIVFLEFFMFISFGFVQIYSLVCKTVRFLSPETAPRNYQLQHMSSSSQMDSEFYMESSPMITVNQSTSPHHHTSEDITATADLAYITLSFTAKTLLAWLILAPTL